MLQLVRWQLASCSQRESTSSDNLTLAEPVPRIRHLRVALALPVLACHKQGRSVAHRTIDATDFAVANAAVGTAVNHHKPFHFRATKLEIDHIRLDKIGLAIYKFPSSTKSSLGKIVGMGRISHDGGDGGMKGSNVTIRIRAYVAPEADPNQIPPDAFVVWESRQNLWVSRGKPQFVPLVAENSSQSEKLNMYFAEITHLEVELEYQLDR